MPVSAHLHDQSATLQPTGQADVVGQEHLQELRDRLDRIDEGMLDLLRDRMRCCEDIARVKQQTLVPMMQPHRVGHVHRRAAAYGQANDVDPEFLRRLYDVVITETCRLETRIIDGVV
jgi:chorismate mutase-like protein